MGVQGSSLPLCKPKAECRRTSSTGRKLLLLLLPSIISGW